MLSTAHYVLKVGLRLSPIDLTASSSTIQPHEARLFPSASGEWATPENQIMIGRQAEALGYDSVWVFHRLLYALAPKNEYPPVPGAVWPKAFESVLDPIVTLAYIAAATKRIRLGTSVLIMPFYAPVALAKQLATLDVLSGGAASTWAWASVGPRTNTTRWAYPSRHAAGGRTSSCAAST